VQQQGFVLIAALVFALVSVLLVHTAVQRALIDARLASDLGSHLNAYNAATNLMNALIAEVDTAHAPAALDADLLSCLSDIGCLFTRLAANGSGTVDSIELAPPDLTQAIALQEIPHAGPLRLSETMASQSNVYQHQLLEVTVDIDGKGRAAHSVLLAVTSTVEQR
jgi:hypothetical protein